MKLEELTGTERSTAELEKKNRVKFVRIMHFLILTLSRDKHIAGA